jgi:hypothetical protein
MPDLDLDAGESSGEPALVLHSPRGARTPDNGRSSAQFLLEQAFRRQSILHVVAMFTAVA